MSDHHPQTPGEQLGLGRQWQPTPALYAWHEVSNGPQRLHVLVIEGVAGTHSLELTPEALDRFIDHAQAARSGLHVQRDPVDIPRRPLQLGGIG